MTVVLVENKRNILETLLRFKNRAVSAVPQRESENRKSHIPSDSIEDQLNQLNTLLEKGLITEVEYKEKRDKIVSNL